MLQLTGRIVEMPETCFSVDISSKAFEGGEDDLRPKLEEACQACMRYPCLFGRLGFVRRSSVLYGLICDLQSVPFPVNSK